MKKLIYLFAGLSACFAQTIYAQELYPQLVPRVTTGFDQIRAEHPYIIQQTKDSTGNWNNFRKYSWSPSAVASVKTFNAVHSWNNGEWQVQTLDRDSLVLNPDGTVFKVFEESSYDFGPGQSNTSNYKYTYSYTPDKKISTFKYDMLLAPGGTYSPYYLLKINYDEQGRRSYDSLVYYNPSFVYVIYCAYDEQNKPIAQYATNPNTGDTLNRIFYTYENNLLKTTYTEQFNQTTFTWEPTATDSLTYENGLVVYRLTYGMVSYDGQNTVFQPTGGDSYTYNEDGKLLTEVIRIFYNGDWRNYAKREFIYSGSVLSLGYVYQANGAGVFDAGANNRYLFTPLTGTREPAPNNLVASVFPNPASDILNIEISNAPHKGEVAYSIYDYAGKLIIADRLEHGARKLTIETLTNGLYFLHPNAGSGKSVLRFAVNK